MSNCIKLRKPDKPFAAMPFNKAIWDRLGNPQEGWSAPQDDSLRWIDAFACDNGQAERKSRPDRIVFYIAFTTNREMSWFLKEIKELGGWQIYFEYGDEYDDYRQTYYWS